ncbi:MAG: MATE family efflux transporter [Oscillospiraceae bacterium]|nr:MATE family efflux transporter [Oscillospiraceae bacterium]
MTSQMTAEQKKFYEMTEAPIAGVIAKLSVPTIISMLVTSIYNMADTYFVSQIGTSASAAVGVIMPLMAIIQAIGFTLGMGSGNMIARLLGVHDRDAASVYAAVGFFTSIGVGLSLMLAAFILGDNLAILLGSTDTILPYARDYMDIIVIGAPFMAASFTLNCQLRFQGRAYISMLGIGFGGVLNMFLDPLFIFGLGMGISGAALATIISQVISFSILLFFCTKKDALVRVRASNFKPSADIYACIMKMGVPSLFRQGTGSIAAIAFNHFAAPYGDAAIAAIGIVNRINMFLFSALIGFGQGYQPVCGYCYGAKKFNRIREGFFFCVKVATVFFTTLGVIVFFNAPDIVALFRREDAEVIAIGTRMLRFECFVLPFVGFYFMNNMLTQTLGRSLRATILACARQGIFFLPALPILSSALGLLGVQLAQPTSEFCSFLLACCFCVTTLRELKQEENEYLASQQDHSL